MVDVPHGWITTPWRDWSTSVSSDRSLTLVIAPLVERSHAKVEYVLARDIDDGTRLQELSRLPTRSYTGWDMAAIMARVVDAKSVEVERRRVAVYELGNFVGAVMMVGAPRAFERHAETIDCVLRSGRPQMCPLDRKSAAIWNEPAPRLALGTARQAVMK